MKKYVTGHSDRARRRMGVSIEASCRRAGAGAAARSAAEGAIDECRATGVSVHFQGITLADSHASPGCAGKNRPQRSAKVRPVMALRKRGESR